MAQDHVQSRKPAHGKADDVGRSDAGGIENRDRVIDGTLL
jgi:hypothetical protein